MKLAVSGLTARVMLAMLKTFPEALPKAVSPDQPVKLAPEPGVAVMLADAPSSIHCSPPPVTLPGPETAVCRRY